MITAVEPLLTPVIEATGSVLYDLEYIKENHLVFVKDARNLINSINDMFKNMDMESQKPLKDTLDFKIIKKLIDACSDFDMDGADEAMDELEKYKYKSDNDLVIWLRECIDRMQFEEIVQKFNS